MSGESRWTCPFCEVGSLRLNSNNIQSRQTKRSEREMSDNPDWLPEYWEGTFAGHVPCSDAGCGESVAVCGRVSVDYSGNPLENSEAEHYQPTRIEPAPPIFRIPKQTPPVIRGIVIDAFGLYWSDLEACANRIRSTVEQILTHLGVARFTRGKGRLAPISLHHRIERLDQVLHREAMMAVKWIGNAGSHAGGIKPNDVLDGFELLDALLHALFDDTNKRLMQIARQINQRKGPRKPKIFRLKKARPKRKAPPTTP